MVCVTCLAALNSCKRGAQKEMRSKLFAAQLQAMMIHVSQKCCMMKRTQLMQHCILKQCCNSNLGMYLVAR